MAPQFKKQPNGTFAPVNSIGPHLASSVNWKSWAPVDKSGIVLDVTKLTQMPTSAQECGPVLIEDNENGRETVRHYEVAWSQAADFAQWAYGYSFVLQSPILDQNGSPTGSFDNFLNRVLPAQDVTFPYLYCDDCRLEQCKGVILPDPGALMVNAQGKPIDYQGNIVPAGGVDQGLWPGVIYAEKTTVGTVDFQDGNAHFRVRFRSRPYPLRNDDDAEKHALGERSRFVQVQREYGVQGLALGKLALADRNRQLMFAQGPFSNPPSVIPEPGTLLMPTSILRVTWHDVPFEPSPGIDACVGKVNSNPFTIAPAWGVFQPGTLLCEAPTVRGPIRNGCGAVSYRAEFRLAVRQNGWNAFPAPDGNFYLGTFGGNPNGPTVFGKADFAQLFAAQPPPAW